MVLSFHQLRASELHESGLRELTEDEPRKRINRAPRGQGRARASRVTDQCCEVDFEDNSRARRCTLPFRAIFGCRDARGRGRSWRAPRHRKRTASVKYSGVPTTTRARDPSLAPPAL